MKNSNANILSSHQIVFGVKDQMFCLPIASAKSILKLPKVFPVPQAPPYIMGVVNVDGEVIPLINATVKLNMGEYVVPENPTMLVLERRVENKSQFLGLHVDYVLDVIECPEHHLRPLPTSKYDFDERLVDGVFQSNEDFIMKINVTSFFKHNLEELNPELTLITH